MIDPLELLTQTRTNALKIASTLSEDQLNKIPDGFNNNIIWNLGHVLVTQQLLCYSLSYKEVIIDQELIAKYRKGTIPNGTAGSVEIDYIQDHLTTSIIRFKHDIKEGIFETYKVYATSYGLTLESINDAIVFNNIHEAMHLGSMLALVKLV